MTVDGYVAAQELQEGDKVLTLNVEDIYGLTTPEEDFASINSIETKETEVVSISVDNKDSSIYQINSNWFVDNTYILSKKDGLVQFTSASEIDESYEIFNVSDMDWIAVENIECIENVSVNSYIIECDTEKFYISQDCVVYNNKENDE